VRDARLLSASAASGTVSKMKAVISVIAGIAMVSALSSAVASPSQTGGQLIAYERWVGDGSPDAEIWVMEPDGSRQRKLADGCCPVWSPDGVIAFRTPKGLSTINPDGTGLRMLTTGTTRRRPPAWSPDGNRIVYVTLEGLFVIAARGGDPTQLTRGFDDVPDWSPNGRKIVFERYLVRPNGSGDAIFVVNADGSGVRQLTDSGQHTPVWSPGGKKIAYWGWESDFEQGVYVMNADGSEQTLVGRTPEGVEGGEGGEKAAWSPTGGRIVFISDGEIHTVRPDGRRHKRIARGRDHEPQWSPDGSSIVFRGRGRAKNQYDIWVMSASGKNPTNLTNTPKPVLETSPAWSPAR
jgi:Tol biopolymer transport system component